MRINPTEVLRQSTALTLLSILVTITTWVTDPRVTWGYEMGVFALAGWAAWRGSAGPTRLGFAAWPAGLIGLFGLLQIAFGATVYKGATLQSWLLNLSLAASAWLAYLSFPRRGHRAAFLRAFQWFAVILSVLSVLSYWTSPGKILWVFPAVYPDNWGPFPSRNTFAQFVELAFPVALWDCFLSSRARRGFEGGSRAWMAAVAPAVLLSAGWASASRAGALLLLAESIAGLSLLSRRDNQERAKQRILLRRPALALALISTIFASVAGAGVLIRRFEDRDPLRIRRELFHSSAAMIQSMLRSSKWAGYGLGTYSTVYPEFAEFDSGAGVEHAHCDWLEWLAEGGPVYAGCWLLLALWTVRPALRSVWGLGVIAVFLHAAVDYPFARLDISAWVFLLIGLLAREWERTGRPEALTEGSKR